jgi:hypothetical protein
MKQSPPIIRIKPRWRQAGPDEKIAAVATLVIVAITITPFCGFLFGCGCTWPGLGLESFCNIHNPIIRHRCPWCVSPWAGILSVAFSACSGTTASVFAFRSNNKNRRIFNLIGRILLGTGVFLLTAFLFGLISASLQNYPLMLSISLK